MAEGIFNDITERKNTSHLFEADSAGTGGYHIGELPDHRTRKNATIHGLNLTHKCRQIAKQDFYSFDYIAAMDDSNMRDITELKPKEELNVKIMKMRFYDPLNKNANVPDPYSGGEKEFEEVYQILLRSCQNFYDSLIG